MDLFVWSDNWWIENEKAWFIPGQGNCNAIFCVDLITKECECVEILPDGLINSFRSYPRCIKLDDRIYCIPCFSEKRIWAYESTLSQFKEIKLNNPNNNNLEIVDFMIYDKSIFLYAKGINQIVELDTKNDVINYYALPTYMKGVVGSACIGNYIYVVATLSKIILEFNLVTKCFEMYSIKNTEEGFNTISYDGDNFWLSGTKRQIYKWNKETNFVEILDDFPVDFGIYNFNTRQSKFLDCNSNQYDTITFSRSISIGDEVWFIPFQTNDILYINKKTDVINKFCINDEVEDEESIRGNLLSHKYIVQYIRDERYIGMFSLKNNYIFEIDILNKSIRKIPFSFTVDAMNKLECEFNKCKKVLDERNYIERMIFLRQILKN